MIVRVNDTIVKGDINAIDKMNYGTAKCQLKYCVGIRASAGGVEALQEFFRNMLLDTDASSVVVQHLSPDSVSMMDKILQKSVKMPVCLVEEDTELRPSEVYLDISGMILEVESGHLHFSPVRDRVQRYAPISQMLNSLASGKSMHIIAMILSGSESDGTTGIGSAKENGGTIIVQKPLEARYVSMPQSATATGLVDLTENVPRIGLTIRNYLRNPNNQYLYCDDGVENQELAGHYNQIIDAVPKCPDIDFSAYKSNAIYRRTECRIAISKYICIEDYMDHPLVPEEKKGPLCNDFLIGVTSFFQDEAALKSLGEHVLTPLP